MKMDECLKMNRWIPSIYMYVTWGLDNGICTYRYRYLFAAYIYYIFYVLCFTFTLDYIRLLFVISFVVAIVVGVVVIVVVITVIALFRLVKEISETFDSVFQFENGLQNRFNTKTDGAFFHL